MGSFDGAEVCELVGLYILNDLAKKYRKEDIGLYTATMGLLLLKTSQDHKPKEIRKTSRESSRSMD